MSSNMQTDILEVKQWKTRRKGDISIWDPKIIRAAIPASFKKLDPRVQVKNPVMFVCEVGAVVTTVEFVRLLFTQPSGSITRGTLTAQTIFVLAVTVWLWFTVVFANFAEPWSLPTSPKRWPRGAAKRRPIRCGGRAPPPWLSGSRVPTTSASCRR